jgi:hypothetical protein
MGSWGTSLYSGDFAADLRSTIRAVLRLPFDADHLARIIADAEPRAARDPEDEDHTTFWLVLADQFARHGLTAEGVTETALRIIDADQDLDMQRRLGQNAKGLEKRRDVLAAVRARIVNPPKPSKRSVLREPQPFVMDVGEALAYPTCGGACRNPYDVRDRLRIYGPGGGQPWTQDGWGAMAIVERGLTLGFFAWYRAIVIRIASESLPDLEALRLEEWRLALPGTCSPNHFRRIGFTRIGDIPVDVSRLHEQYPELRPGDSQAISDITIANRLGVLPHGRSHNSFRRAAKERPVSIADLLRPPSI